jgi:hypothetical protein
VDRAAPRSYPHEWDDAVNSRALVGSPITYAGTSGSVTIGVGESLLHISAWTSAASATVTIFGQPSGGIPIPQSTSSHPTAIWSAFFEHDLLRSTSNSNAIVFTNTASYFVHTVRLGGTAGSVSKL